MQPRFVSEHEQQSAELWVRQLGAAFHLAWGRRADSDLLAGCARAAALGCGGGAAGVREAGRCRGETPGSALQALGSLPRRAAMEVMNMMEQPIKVTEWQQTYTYDSGIHSGVNTQVPSVSSKCLGDDDEVYGKQYTIKKTTTSYCQGGGQSQSQAQGRGLGREGMPRGSAASSAAFLLPSSTSPTALPWPVLTVLLLGTPPRSLPHPGSCCCLKYPPSRPPSPAPRALAPRARSQSPHWC